MNYKIAICDDSDVGRQYISGLVTEWVAKWHVSLYIRSNMRMYSETDMPPLYWIKTSKESTCHYEVGAFF